MQNILYFLYRYSNVLLFVLLEILCLNLVIRYNSNQQEIFIRSSNSLSGWILHQHQSITQFFGLTEVANELAEENANLRKNYPIYHRNTGAISTLVTDSLSEQQYELMPAVIINNSIHALENFFTLALGTDAGVQKGMGVIQANGIVGIITDANRRYARGISILNRDCKISVAIKKNHFFGTLQWHGGDPRAALLGDIPKHASATIGDTIETSGYSTIFPAGLKVGVISTVELTDGSNFYDIDIKLSNDLSNVHYVYVVKNLFAIDQLDIEGNNDESNGR